MAYSDLYELRINGTVASQEVVNVFHLERVSSVYTAQDLTNAFENWVLPSWRLSVHSGFQFLSAYAYRLADAEDWHERFFTSIFGQRTGGEAYAPFVACAMRFARKRLDMRNGYKRFAGLSEADVTGGLISTTVQSLFLTLGGKLMGVWETDEADAAFHFHIVKRVPYTPAGSTKTAYRLPESAGEYIYYRPSDVSVPRELTSQNTRKIGRGA